MAKRKSRSDILLDGVYQALTPPANMSIEQAWQFQNNISNVFGMGGTSVEHDCGARVAEDLYGHVTLKLESGEEISVLDLEAAKAELEARGLPEGNWH